MNFRFKTGLILLCLFMILVTGINIINASEIVIKPVNNEVNTDDYDVFITDISSVDIDIQQEQLIELLNLFEEYDIDIDPTSDINEILNREDVEIVGFTNINKGYIDVKNLDKYDPLNYLFVYYVQPGDSLFKIAREFNTTVSRIKEENNLQTDMIYVRQPLFIPSTDLPIEEVMVYFVERGDSLYKIAQRFNTTIENIRKENNLESDMLNIGQKLYIDLSGSNRETKNYTVQPGDSLYRIALRFNTTVDKLRQTNNLYTDMLYIGQIIRIPAADESDENFSKRTYTVRAGDSLFLIARRFNTTISAIRQANNLQSDIIYIGQQLYIPLSSSDPTFSIRYRVESGKTLFNIAREFDISAEDIRSINQLSSDYLNPGREILLPFSVPENDLINYNIFVNDEELKLLARAVYSEARGEPFKGQVAVAAVVLNRIQSPLFPNTVREVIFQPWQFEAVDDGQFWLEPDQKAFIASRAALKGWDPSRRAIFYYNPKTAESEWIFTRNVVIRIGQHYFAV